LPRVCELDARKPGELVYHRPPVQQEQADRLVCELLEKEGAVLGQQTPAHAGIR